MAYLTSTVYTCFSRNIVRNSGI